jgi:membrane-bound ClpP family serine protease
LATVHTTLSPNGSVFVDGELWLAESLDGKLIREKQKVMVMGLRDHLLLVRPVSDEL